MPIAFTWSIAMFCSCAAHKAHPGQEGLKQSGFRGAMSTSFIYHDSVLRGFGVRQDFELLAESQQPRNDA